MLTLTKLEKSFSTGSGYVHKALDGLSLNVEKGDFITIVGSNGAGKSTLFNAICGDFFVDRGRIALEGKDITYLPAHKRSAHHRPTLPGSAARQRAEHDHRGKPRPRLHLRPASGRCASR